MGSSTKINSIEINLTDANNEVGMVACDGFSISEFIGAHRHTNRTTCWPFPEERASFGLWPSLRGTRNIDADGANDSGLPSSSAGIISTNGLNGSSSIIPSQSELNSPTAIDQEKEMNTNIADNAVVVNEDVNCVRSQNADKRDNAVVENEDSNCERSQQDDQRDNAVEENEDVNCERSHKDDQTTGNNALALNEDVNCERSQKDDRRVTRSSKRVHPSPLRTYALRNKSTKNAVTQPLGNKRAEKQPNVEQVAVAEIAACVEDAQAEESESRGLFIGGAPSGRTRKVRTRRLADLNGTRRDQNISRKSLSGQKRKSLPGSSKLSKKVSTAGAASGNASKSVESAHGGSEPTENGFDTDPLKGKKKNVRFQVDDELDSDFEVNDEELDSDFEDDADPYPPRAKRTKKVKIAKKKRATNSNKASSSTAQPSLNENETVPSPPREQGTEERVGASLEDQLASDGYVRKPNAPLVNESQDDNRMRSSYVPVFGPSIPNTGRGLGTGPGASSSSNNNNDNQRSTPSSTQVAAQSVVPQKVPTLQDAFIPNTCRGMRTGRGASYIAGSSNNNNLRSTPPSTVVAAQPSVPQEDPSIPRGPRTGRGGSSNNNNLRNAPPSTVVAAQTSVPQKDASIPNTGRGLETRSGAIYSGSRSNSNNQRSTPPSTQVAAQSTVPQKDASIPNTGRGLGTGLDEIYFGSSNNNNSQRSTPSSTQVAAQSSVLLKDASILNTGRGLGTRPGSIFGSSSNNNNNQRRVTPPSTVVADQSTVPQKDASTPNTGRGLGAEPGAILFSSRINNNNLRSTPPSTVVSAQSSVPQKDASVPNTGRELGTGRGDIYLGGRNSNNNYNNNLRSTPPSTVVTAQSSVPQKDASVSDRKGKGVMVQNDDLQEVPQKPKTPFLFDLNETYEDVTSLEDNTNAAREEEARVPVRSEQAPRRNSYMASSSVMPPPVQESRRSSILFPSHNPQWMGNVPMASPYHHPSPSTYQAIRVPPHQFRVPSPPVWASPMIPPQYHHHNHLTPPAPFNMDYPSTFAQAPSSEPWNLSYYGASLLNQAMMSHMDPRFRSNTPVDHHGNFVFTPRHVHPVNHFNQLVELRRSHERPVYPRTISNQGRFQPRRNAASSSNASTSRAVNSADSSECIVSRYPGEITDIEPYMVPEEYLRVPERIAEFEQVEDQVGPFTESG